MDYLGCYNRLMDRAKSREVSGYVEKHHIVPKCMGGSKDPSNIAVLTPEEHYLAHQLLVKIYPNHYGILWSASNMTLSNHRQKRSNKLYGWLRRRLAEKLRGRFKGRKPSEETRRKMSAARKGVARGPHSEETKQKMSLASKGKPKSMEHRRSLSEAKMGKTGQKQSKDWIEKRIIACKKTKQVRGRPKHLDSAKYQEERSLQMEGIWAKRRMGILPMPAHLKVEGV